jgi:hypothetical protein
MPHAQTIDFLAAANTLAAKKVTLHGCTADRDHVQYLKPYHSTSPAHTIPKLLVGNFEDIGVRISLQ